MENKPDNYEELREYKNRAWQAEGRIKTQQLQLRVIFALLLMLALITIAQAVSYQVNLGVRGLNERYVLVTGRRNFSGGNTAVTRAISRWFGHNNEYRVIFSERPGRDDSEFAVLRRNRLGFWSVWNRNSERHPYTGCLTFIWSGRFSWNVHPTRWENRDFSMEVHFFYFNTNARALISIDSDRLPPNTAVFVIQHSNFYLLHFVSYEMNSFSWDYVDNLLEGYVTPRQ